MTENLPSDLSLPAAEATLATTRGICRHFFDLGFAVLPEFSLANNRRADVIALSDSGEFVIVEIKVSIADFRGDTKWPEYEEFCDRLFFGVPPDFPSELIPDSTGLLIADAWGAEEMRPAPPTGMHASRRKALTLRFARAAADRHQRLWDPRI